MELNLPQYTFRYGTEDGKKTIFDPVRKKYVRLTPEEWVRQNLVQFLIQQKGYPESLIQIEGSIKVNELSRRCDIVCFNNALQPILVVECKAPTIKITQDVFDQIARYNMTLQVNHIVVSNGLDHYCCFVDFEKKKYSFLEEIPNYI